MSWKKIVREPLLHFLVAGGVLFLLFTLIRPAGPDSPSDKTITVDDERLLQFLQYRSKAFETEYFTQQLKEMSEAELNNLVDQYIEEEMLYREAKSLRLEEGDYVIRQRLVQKMRFLIDDLTEGDSAPSDTVLEEYLQKHKDIYMLEPSFTFTHVFVDPSIHGETAAERMAERLKTELSSRGARFNDAPQYGDRFPFLENYVERTIDYIESHFGAEFLSGVAKLTPSETRWNGPIRSMHGYHLVLLTARSEARLPALSEIRAQVAEDWARDRTQAARSRGLQRLAGEYTIERRDRSAKGSK